MSNYFFSESDLTPLYNAVPSFIEETVSLCHVCYNHLPALKYEKDGKLYLVKYCKDHGIHHYVIENDIDFYQSLNCEYNKPWDFNGGVMIEGSDRCNLDCPHCYHIPNNKIQDPAQELLMSQVADIESKMRWPGDPFWVVLLAGAEPTLRKDFPYLLERIKTDYNNTIQCYVMSNGIKFEDVNFVKSSKSAGLDSVCFGLNHPTYNNNMIIRNKQERAVYNILEEDLGLNYLSYTMNNFNELNDIMQEILYKGWTPTHFRIRYGSDIGRNTGQERLFLSDVFKSVQRWCQDNNKSFEIIEPADNNIYHIMVKVEDIYIRLIQWCDEYDIDMESLKSGPWSDFTPGSITNFLNQIIRRNAWKNKGLTLLDSPPERYHMRQIPITDKLDLKKLI